MVPAHLAFLALLPWHDPVEQRDGGASRRHPRGVKKRRPLAAAHRLARAVGEVDRAVVRHARVGPAAPVRREGVASGQDVLVRLPGKRVHQAVVPAPRVLVHVHPLLRRLGDLDALRVGVLPSGRVVVAPGANDAEARRRERAP
eukprot:SAG31_NODE_12291_length_952_cov_0.994138_2_plen_144_part_00